LIFSPEGKPNYNRIKNDLMSQLQLYKNNQQEIHQQVTEFNEKLAMKLQKESDDQVLNVRIKLEKPYTIKNVS